MLSLSARRAWIEIRRLIHHLSTYRVALRKESVDRNTNPGSTTLTFPVALRKESVDRNAMSRLILLAVAVALRKESVDRNTQRRDFKRLGLLSLSARRAWIEIWWLRCWQLAARGRSPQGERG